MVEEVEAGAEGPLVETLGEALTGVGVGIGSPKGPVPREESDDLQVGGRLSQFIHKWRELTQDIFVLRTIAEGYRIEFTAPWTLCPRVPQSHAPATLEQRTALREEIRSMLAKKAIVKLSEPHLKSPGFYSHMFMRRKSSGAWRPILNLKRLNKSIVAKKFRMDTIPIVVASLQKGEWVTSIDLRDAYFHVTVHPDHRKFLRFVVEGNVYQFRVLPFGLSTAPRVFTRIVKVLMAYLRKRGIKIFSYLDDWLIGHTCPAVLREHTELALSETEFAGFIINRDKSDLEPTQKPIYLGAELDMVRGLVRPSPDRVNTIELFVRDLLREGSAPAQYWLQLLGRLASCKGLVPASMLNMRLLQYCLQSQWNRTLPVSVEVTFPATLRPHLGWWLDRDNTLKGVPFHRVEPSVVLTTDASCEGWGGAHRRPTGCRLVGAGGGVGAHQHAGAQGSFQSSQAFCAKSDRSHGSDSVRQHNRGGLYKQAGGDKVLVPVSLNLGPLCLVLGQQGPVSSLSLAREAKLPCGRPIQREGQSDRMEPAREHSAVSIPVVGETAHRPVCKQGECETPHVLHAGPGQFGLGNRRVQHQLGGDLRLRVSPHLTNPQGSEEVTVGTLPDAPNSSAMAETTLVSNTGVVARESPPGSPGEGGSLESGEEVVSPAREPTLDCVASVKQSFRQAGLSEQAASLATAARRESTLRVYSSRVRHWTEWCSQGGHDSYHAPVNIVAEYLTCLFHKGFQTNTIAGYRSAIGSIHKGFEDGSTVSNNTTLHSVVKGAFTLRPPVQRLVPQWSLTLVLRRLAEAPYEPLGRASLKCITLKCGFLLALATGRRSSQITALSVHPDHLVWTKQGVRMTPHLGFLAKNQRLNFTPEPISLQEMKYHSDTREDKLWCPVRALKFYIDKTKAIRNSDQLFIKIVNPHDGVKTVTFASWIVQTIKAAYGPNQAPGVQARAHDVRGVSASWAKFNNVSLTDILQAAAWNTPSTFTTCYVKDIFAAEGQYGLQVVAAAAKSASHTGDK